MSLSCPKCQGEMRSYERNGVHVDQCTECRGIFLDRGELEHLVDAENSWHGSAPTPTSQGQSTSPGQGSLGAIVGEVLQQAKTHKQSGHGQQHGYPHRKKKSSFLDELFG